MKSTKLIAIGTAVVIVFIVLGGIAFSNTTQKPGEQTATQPPAMNNYRGSQAANEAALNAFLGKEAPDFTLESYDGKRVNLKSLRGKKVVLFFTEGVMCYPACWNQMAAFGKDPAFSSDDTVTLSITTDQKSEWEQAFDRMPDLAKMTVLFDSNRAVSTTYGVLSLPSSMHKGQFPGHTYLILDRNGVVRYVKDDPQMGVRNDELKAELGKVE